MWDASDSRPKMTTTVDDLVEKLRQARRAGSRRMRRPSKNVTRFRTPYDVLVCLNCCLDLDLPLEYVELLPEGEVCNLLFDIVNMPKGLVLKRVQQAATDMDAFLFIDLDVLMAVTACGVCSW